MACQNATQNRESSENRLDNQTKPNLEYAKRRKRHHCQQAAATNQVHTKTVSACGRYKTRQRLNTLYLTRKPLYLVSSTGRQKKISLDRHSRTSRCSNVFLLFFFLLLVLLFRRILQQRYPRPLHRATLSRRCPSNLSRNSIRIFLRRVPAKNKQISASASKNRSKARAVSLFALVNH